MNLEKLLLDPASRIQTHDLITSRGLIFGKFPTAITCCSARGRLMCGVRPVFISRFTEQRDISAEFNRQLMAPK